MVKRLVGLICYERFPRGMGGGFQSGPSGMAERADAWLCSVLG